MAKLMLRPSVHIGNVDPDEQDRAAFAASIGFDCRSGITDQSFPAKGAALRTDFHLWHSFIKRTTNVFAVSLLSATLTIAVGDRILTSNDAAGSASARSPDLTPAILAKRRSLQVGAPSLKSYDSHAMIALSKPPTGVPARRHPKDATPPATKLADAKSSTPTQDRGAPDSRSSASKGGSAAARKPTIRAGDGLRFDQPVPFGAKPVLGQTLKQLAKGKPLFAPIEGLPENLWKKSCTTCHKWNRARLCKQGATYVKSAKGAFRHQHPYGGPYKLALMRWASSGCK